jgi:hypothetical protein
MKGMKYSAALAALVLAAQPCAAADFGSTQQGSHAAGAFAGATLKLGFNGQRRKAPAVQLGLGISQTLRRYGSAAAVQMPALELSLTPSGKPRLLVSGQDPAAAGQRLGLTAGVALLALGGLGAGALLLASASGGSEEDELDLKQCFLPEKELCK